MEKIFETEAIRIMVSASNDVYVTGKNQTCFTNDVLKSLGAEIYRLQNELNKTQPMATLEHTSEPDLRHYHYYAEHKIENISFDGYLSCTWDGNGEGAGGELVEAVKQSTCELAWQKKVIKSNPDDWVIKSLSRL